MTDHYTEAQQAYAAAQYHATMAVADLIREYLTYAITKALVGDETGPSTPVDTERGHGTHHDAVMAALTPYDHAGDTTPLADIADEILSALNRVDSSPRIWALPPQPGPAITSVRDRDGDVWDRVEHGWTSGGCTPRSWRKLVAQFGPLTEVTEGRTR